MRNACASTHSGRTASVTAEAQVETMAMTLLTSISLRAARTPASALVWSSSWKSCTGRPRMPPALLIRSTTATTDRCMSGPYEPPAPVSGHKVPMLIGAFDCAARIAGAPSTSPIVAEAFKSSRRVIVVLSGPTACSLAAERETSKRRVVAQHGPGALRADAAHREHVGPPTQGERLARILLDEEDAEATRVDLANAIEHEALE